MGTAEAPSVPSRAYWKATTPSGVDPETDLLAPPQDHLPLWSETMFFCAWDPKQGSVVPDAHGRRSRGQGPVVGAGLCPTP